MNSQALATRQDEQWPHLCCCQDAEPVPASVRWRINGYPARLLIWSRDEWEKLTERPVDAQLHPLGVWCALRLD